MEICEHLQPILDYELRRGNRIKEISRGWEKADMVIDLACAMDVEYENTQMALDPCVRYWVSDDLHYAHQGGFYCNKCRQGISYPKVKAKLYDDNRR